MLSIGRKVQRNVHWSPCGTNWSLCGTSGPSLTNCCAASLPSFLPKARGMHTSNMPCSRSVKMGLELSTVLHPAASQGAKWGSWKAVQGEGDSSGQRWCAGSNPVQARGEGGRWVLKSGADHSTPGTHQGPIPVGSHPTSGGISTHHSCLGQPPHVLVLITHPSSLDKRCMSGKVGKCESSVIAMSRGGRFMQTFILISISSLSHHLLFWPSTWEKLNSLPRLTWTQPWFAQAFQQHPWWQAEPLPTSFGKQPPSPSDFMSNLFDKSRWSSKWYRNLKAGMFCLAGSFTREISKYNSTAIFILFKCLRTLHLTEDNRLENCLYKMQEVVAVFSGMWYCFALRWHPYGCSHPSPCPITLSLSAFWHASWDHISCKYPGPRRSADTGQHLGCWKLYFCNMLTAKSQEGETFYWSQCWIQGWTYQKCIMNSAHKHYQH